MTANQTASPLFDRARRLTRLRRLAYAAAAILAAAVVASAILVHHSARPDGLLPPDPDLIKAAAAPANPRNGPPTAFLEGGVSAIRPDGTTNVIVPCRRCHVREDFTWAPSGRLVAVATTSILTNTGYEGIHVIDLRTGRDRTIVGGVNFVRGLAWSPDGSRLAYVVDADPPRAKELRVTRADGSTFAQRVDIGPGTPSSPTWSPDGRRLAYGLWSNGHSAVYVKTLGGSRPVLVAPRGSSPAWSPHGSKIAIRGCGGIKLITPSGKDVTPRSRADPCPSIGRPASPVWSPDGTMIAITSRRLGVFVVSARGGPARLLTLLEVRGDAGDARLSWRPRR
jgi:DNA-binding beta-propeller fold protein YncE